MDNTQFSLCVLSLSSARVIRILRLPRLQGQRVQLLEEHPTEFLGDRTAGYFVCHTLRNGRTLSLDLQPRSYGTWLRHCFLLHVERGICFNYIYHEYFMLTNWLEID